MKRARWATRAAVSAAFVIFAGPAGAAGQPGSPLPPTGTLAGGVAYEVRADPAQPGAAVALWYRAPSSGFGAAPVPALSRLAAATVAASTPITGTPLSALVARYGGRLSVEAYPDSVAITAVVPPDRVADTVRAMTADYFAPVVTDAGLRLARSDVTEAAELQSLEPEDAIEDALGAALFASGPSHDGTIGSPETLRTVDAGAVRAFAERAFRPSNAIVVLTGDVDASALSAVAARAGAPAAGAAAAPEPAAAQTRRDGAEPLRRTGEVRGIGLGWAGPPIVDETDATAMDFLADALFAPRTGLVPKALGDRKATVTGRFVTFRDPGLFLVTLTGPDAEAARPIVERTVAAAARPMSGAAFAAAHAAYVYRLLGAMETPGDVASVYGWYTVEGDAPYAPAERGGRYSRLAAGLTPQSVARAAARYLGPSPAVVVIAPAAPAVKT
ncbi:MAG TPA: insulinase family protein [Candidatus Baltobacteraceae bacterium]|nr:insulinase family protein [Candidatus Baltobacteraceae bacterium]